MRTNTENELTDDMVRQGIAQSNYPQYGTSFWGNNLSNATNYDISKLSPTVQNALNLARNLPVNCQQTQGQQNNTGILNSVQNFAEDVVNAVAPYTPTYYAGYAIGTAHNIFNKLKDLYGAYKQNGATYAAQHYGEPSVRQAMKATDWLSPLDMPDVNKHQYVSCIGSTGGPLAMTETIIGGVKKEIDDYNKKMNNQDLLKQYGGKWGVIGDGFKDLGNDIRGALIGISSNSPEECEELLPEKYRNQRFY